MRTFFIGLGLLSGAVLGIAAACDTNENGSCTVGALECACTPGGGCDPGLDCVGEKCIVVHFDLLRNG